MMISPTAERTDYALQATHEETRRDRLNRALRLLRRLKESLAAGDPLPPLPEILAMTGLEDPREDTLGGALDALLAQAEAERASVNRRLRLARELRGVMEHLGQRPAPEPPRPAPAGGAPGVNPAGQVPASSAPASSAPVSSASVPAATDLRDELPRLAAISARELDTLPYGCILLDNSGRVIGYNDTESRMARLPVEAVLGRNFFTEVAPCTRVKDFEGRFRDLAGGRTPQVVQFEFTFPFPFGAQRVAVLLTRGSTPGTVLMALLRR